MSRDFGQRGNGGRQARGRDAMPGWVWGLAGLAIGLGVAAYVHVSNPLQSGAGGPAAPVPNGKAAKKVIELPPKEQPRFEFYTLLPKYEVAIQKKKTYAGGPPPVVAEPGMYFIQAGSFRDRAEAEQHRANLALIGLESRAEEAPVDGRPMYRVIVGPEKDIARAHTVMTRLTENGIANLLVQVKP